MKRVIIVPNPRKYTISGVKKLIQMELKLVRKYCKETYTIGHLYVIENGKTIWVGDTLEDKVRDYNKDGDLLDEGETKVYGQTCIPYGKYVIDMCVSNRFKPRFWGLK